MLRLPMKHIIIMCFIIPTTWATSESAGRIIINPYQYKYQGQERQDELGLNWDSFKWRNYDYAIGRFMSVDPLAEKYKKWSGYNYAMNNPVYFIDPDGNRIIIGKNDYSYQENRNYGALKNDFERATYKVLDMLYASKAMNITIGEGEKAKTVNILDELINDNKNKIKIKEGKESSYDFKRKTLSFNYSQGVTFFIDPKNPYSKG